MFLPPLVCLLRRNWKKSSSKDIHGHICDSEQVDMIAGEKVNEDGAKSVEHKQTTAQDACFEAELSDIKFTLDKLNNRLSVLKHSLTSIRKLYSNTTQMLDKSSKIDQLFDCFDKLKVNIHHFFSYDYNAC